MKHFYDSSSLLLIIAVKLVLGINYCHESVDEKSIELNFLILVLKEVTKNKIKKYLCIETLKYFILGFEPLHSLRNLNSKLLIFRKLLQELNFIIFANKIQSQQ